MVFSSSTEKGDTADIDFLDGICDCASGFGDGIGEGVEVADDDGDGRDVLGLEVLLIGRDVACEDA